jgi:Protein of unknown function (DUF3618)
VAQTADQLEADIVHTRQDMSSAMDRVGDQMSPKQVLKGGTHRLSQWIQSARDGIMGTVSAPSAPVGQGPEGLGEGPGQSRHDSGSITAQNQGNPLAAGIIAFGVGLLIGSVLRPTKVEQQGLSAIADKAEPAIDAAIQAASELGHGVQKSTEQAASELGDVLKEAGQEIVDKTRASTSEAAESVKPSPTE